MPLRHGIEACAIVLVVSGGAWCGTSSEIADAAMKGNTNAVRSLLAKRADVNAPQADGATAIQWAVYNNDLAMVNLLVAAGANVKTPNRDGATPLSLASINGNAAIIEKLLMAGADPNERRVHGETALMFASRTGSVEAIKVLVDHGADVNSKEDLRGTTALIWAAEQQHSAAVRILIEHGADVNAGDSVIPQRGSKPNVAPVASQRAAQVSALQGLQLDSVAQVRAQEVLDPYRTKLVGKMAPLHFAAREGDLESARILVTAGANVNAQTVDQWTPLAIATQNGNYKLALYLLDNGANPNLSTDGGWTPLYLATDNRNAEGGEYPVRPADMDHLDFIKKLLDHKADVNARAKDYTETRTNFTMQWLNEDGATPFLRAAQSGDVTLMKLLLARGADPKIATRNNTTALHVAAGIGWVEGITWEWSTAETLSAVKLCLELGIDVNAVDNDGRTALQGAAHKGRNDVVRLLVASGAKLDALDKGSRDTLSGELLGHKWMALDYAEGRVRVGVQSAIAHPETAALLRQLMKNAGIPVPSSGDPVCVGVTCK
jgi:uncharacterized protein